MCRRYPPTLIADWKIYGGSGPTDGFFPEITDNEICGEWTCLPKEEKQERTI